MQQTELTFLAKSLIKTMYKEQPYYEGAMCVCGTGGTSQEVLIFRRPLHL